MKFFSKSRAPVGRFFQKSTVPTNVYFGKRSQTGARAYNDHDADNKPKRSPLER